MSRKRAEPLCERLDKLRALGTDARLIERIEKYAAALVVTADNQQTAGEWLASARDCLDPPIDGALLAALAMSCPRNAAEARDWGAM